jgi:hypothetical protein
MAEVRKGAISLENGARAYLLADFTETSMQKDAIPGSPFRAFESVPQGRQSKRKQNDTLEFDAYSDTLFDYPIVVKKLLNSDEDSLLSFNWHLTIQVPFCVFDCWHCYNDQGVPTAPYTAKAILDRYAECRRALCQSKREYNVLRLSGGEPFLVPELVAELLELMETGANPDYPKAIWTETNLLPFCKDDEGQSIFCQACKTSSEQSRLDIQGILQRNRDRLIIHPCFHGLSDRNIGECTNRDGVNFRDLMNAFQDLHRLDVELYPTFITEACDPNHLAHLFEGLRRIDPKYPLKVALISTEFYPPVLERMAGRRGQFHMYSRYACLQRWNELLRRQYGVHYAQVLRPLADSPRQSLPPTKRAEGDNSSYRPLLYLMKSVFRKEYKQEILSIIAGPPGMEVTSSYDVDHVENSTLEWLRSMFGEPRKENAQGSPRAVILYGNPDAADKEIGYLVLRQAEILDVTISARVVSFRLALGAYVLPRVLGSTERDVLLSFSNRVLRYFGRSTLRHRPSAKWVILGEEALLTNGENEPGLEPCADTSSDRNELRNGWDRLLDIIKCGGEFRELRDKSVFLQLLLPHGLQRSTSSSRIHLQEGEKEEFSFRYYIPDFAYYDRTECLLKARTVVLASTASSLRIDGYRPAPLPKYGEHTFEVVCDELPHATRAQLVLESASKSYSCPRLTLEFMLKKAGASERSSTH